MTAPITRFDGPYRFLSNFFPVEIELDGLMYPSLEHAYQAAKTTVLAERERIRQAGSPGIAKRLGRAVTLRGDWNQQRRVIMHELLCQKFLCYPSLRKELAATGDALLVEGNTWGDTYWGSVLQQGNWIGQNLLGRMLMNIRRFIKEKVDEQS